MRDVPYYTTDDESQWVGHVWQQRDRIGGRWGFMWEIIPPFDTVAESGGWRSTQEQAESAMEQCLKFKRKPNDDGGAVGSDAAGSAEVAQIGGARTPTKKSGKVLRPFAG